MMLTADGLSSVTSIIGTDRSTEDHIPLFHIADCCNCFHYEQSIAVESNYFPCKQTYMIGGMTLYVT